MTFRKFARVQTIAAATYGEAEGATAAGLRKTAQVRQGATSAYLDGTRKIDVRGILAEVADKFGLSTDPQKYIYEIVRACTASAANENGDAFPRDELLRFDTRRGIPVFATFIKKPHHLNHKTADSKQARGVILDAFYNEDTGPLASCPTCHSKTAEREARDESGLHCRKCGSVVKDEFVELVIAIDAQKDPHFARGVAAGVMNATSMGCDCEEASCLVCTHVARSPQQFCAHIRGANKRSYWIREAASDPSEENSWRKIAARDVKRVLEEHGYTFNPAGFRSVRVASVVIARANEDCRQVEFQEQSAVGHPADPKALQRALLRIESAPVDKRQRLVAALERRLRRYAEVRAVVATKFYVLRVDGDDMDTFAGETIEEALDLAQPDEGSLVEAVEVEADDPGHARVIPAQAAGRGEQLKWKPIDPAEHGYSVDLDGEVTLTIPDDMHVNLVDPNNPDANNPDDPNAVPQDGQEQPMNGLPGDQRPGVPSTPTQQVEDVSDRAIAPKQPLTPEEMGIMPTPASKPEAPRAAARSNPQPFKQAYASLYGLVEANGTIIVGDSALGDAELFSLSANKPLETEAERVAAANELFADVFTRGLVPVMAARKATPLARFAQIADDATRNIDAPEPTAPTSITQDATAAEDRGTPASPDSHVQDPEFNYDATAPDQAGPGAPADGGMRAEDRPDPKHETISEGSIDTRGDQPAANIRSEDLTSEGMQNIKAQLERRYKSLYAAKEKRIRAEAEAQVQAANQTAVARILRAVKLVNARRTRNVEESPLKREFIGVLTSEREVGRDAQTHEALVYAPMQEDLAVHLVEAVYQAAGESEIETLFERAAELLTYEDSYFASAEADIAKQAAYIPQITAPDVLDTLDASAARAASLTESATRGSLPIQPAPLVEGAGPAESSQRHAEIRAAVAGLGRRTRPEQQSRHGMN